MALKFIGGCGIALGILVLLAALAQPATVTETSTSCVDSSYFGQDCSTVEYERPNHERAQLFGGGVFLLFTGLITYGVGAARHRSSGPSGGTSTASPQAAPSTADDGALDGAQATAGSTLREQLDARQAQRQGSVAETVDRDAGDAVDATSIGTEFDSSTVVERESRATPSSHAIRRLPPIVVVTGSGLASAFVLSWLLSGAMTVESVGLRALAFSLFALPGLVLSRRYATADPDAESSIEGGTDR